MKDGLTGFHRALFDAANDAMFVADAESGTIIDANRKASELLDLPVVRIVGMNQTALHPSGDAGRYARIFDEAIRSERGITEEVYALRADGKRIPVEISVSVMEWQDRRVILGIFRDLSERERIQREIREHRDRIQQYLNVIEVMVVVLDKQGRITLLNRKGHEILGHEQGAILGESWFDTCIPERFRAAVREVFSRMMEGEEKPLEFYENPVLTASGEERILAWHNVILRDDSGRITGSLSSGEDITERRIAKDALRESEARYRLLVDKFDGVICIFHVDGHLLYVNERGADKLGGPAASFEERPLHEVFPHEADMMIERHRGVIHSGIGGDFEDLIHLPTGDRWFWSNVQPVKDANGRSFAVQVISYDITERREAEAARREMIRELEAKNAELERYTYTVSHDLKTPLITIQGYLGLLERDLEKGRVEEARGRIGRITRGADKMYRMLGELLDLSRSGRILAHRERIPCEPLVREAVELAAGPIDHGEIDIAMAPDLPDLFGDRTRLLEVFHNLIENALKFTEGARPPRVEIGARTDGTEPVYFVRDNGIGIEPAYADKVFGLFDKLDGDSDGTGIGLAVVKRIIEVHGGRIWVESKGPGTGSTFSFTLPGAPKGMQEEESDG